MGHALTSGGWKADSSSPQGTKAFIPNERGGPPKGPASRLTVFDSLREALAYSLLITSWPPKTA